MLSEVPESALTPAALKALSQSVMDLSSVSEMRDISKSTSDLMTGSLFKKKELARKIRHLTKGKTSDSKSSLLHSSAESVDTLEVR